MEMKFPVSSKFPFFSNEIEKRKPENVANAINKILQMRKFASVKG